MEYLDRMHMGWGIALILEEKGKYLFFVFWRTVHKSFSKSNLHARYPHIAIVEFISKT